MDSIVQTYVKKQRKLLSNLIGGLLSGLAKDVAPMMLKPDLLNDLLILAIKSLPYCKYIYVLDHDGIQLSSTLKHQGEKSEDIGRDRSDRPYIKDLFSARNGVDFELSSAYISKNKKRPSLTAVQIIRNEAGERLGFLGVDYDLRELPRNDRTYEEPREWRQLKGDPAIRGGLFLQQRVESQMDKNLDVVITVLEELMTEHGVYHCKIHYSSSRVTLWHVDDPYSYRILTMDELSDTEICLVYPKRPFFDRNIVSKDQISKLFTQFKALRYADETIYLRSSSINLVNGFVGLNFSCDGSHYLSYEEFLGRGLDFWFGVSAEEDLPACPSKDISKEEINNNNSLDDLLEGIAQRGCLEVNQFIHQMDAGMYPSPLDELNEKEQQYIHDELKSVMSVYDGGVCSI